MSSNDVFFTEEDEVYMRLALQLAEKGRYTAKPNPVVGCVVVKDGSIVGRGWHAYAGGPHAEVVALKEAGSFSIGSTVYVTLEPCCHTGRTGPCVDALLKSGINRVVIAMRDPNPKVFGKGIRKLVEQGVEVHEGLLAQEASDLNREYVKRGLEN